MGWNARPGPEVLIMKRSTTPANFDAGCDEQSAEQALESWISEHGSVCYIDTANPICPRFAMTCDDIERYRKAIDAFGELWICFNDEGMSEETFMSAYAAARQKTRKM
jgi:hypothetical protein